MKRLIDADALKGYFQIGGDETSCEGCEHLKARGCYEERLLSDFCSAIDEQPTIDAVPHWIPCSERLPEKNGYYLTTTCYRQVYCDFWNEDHFDRTEAVIAWMPLPKPYEVKE